MGVRLAGASDPQIDAGAFVLIVVLGYRLGLHY